MVDAERVPADDGHYVAVTLRPTRELPSDVRTADVRRLAEAVARDFIVTGSESLSLSFSGTAAGTLEFAFDIIEIGPIVWVDEDLDVDDDDRSVEPY